MQTFFKYIYLRFQLKNYFNNSFYQQTHNHRADDDIDRCQKFLNETEMKKKVIKNYVYILKTITKY